MRNIRLLPSLLVLLIFSSCFRHEQKEAGTSREIGSDSIINRVAQPPAMQVRLEQSRVLDTVMIVDVSGGVPMTFVCSRDTTTFHPVNARFDRMQSFTWSAQDSAWHEAASDSFAFGTALIVHDVTGDGKPDLIAATSTGVDDSLAATGCVIYSAHDGAWKQVFASQTGNPDLRDIDNNGTWELLVRDAYAGVMPQTDAIEYISDIYTFDGARYVAGKSRFPKFYEQLIARAKDDYARVKTQVPVNSPISDEFDFILYRPCAAVIVTYHASGNPAGAKTFWTEEKQYLSRMLPPAQYIDIEALVNSR